MKHVKFEIQGLLLVPLSHIPLITNDIFQMTLGVHLAFDLF